MNQSAENDLALLLRKLLEVESASEELVRDAVHAMTEQDAALAEKVISGDAVIDALEAEIELVCLRLMAQPLTLPDFRLTGAALKAVTDIERIGDHAVDIARIALRMQREMIYKPLADIPRLSETACRLIRVTLEAFASRDSGLADAALASEAQYRALCRRTQTELQAAMHKDLTSVGQVSYLLFVVHYLERIGSHCANIAERIAFVKTGHRQTVRRETSALKSYEKTAS